MKAVLVIDIPNEYAERYNINEMYVWSLTVQDKQGYQMFDLTTDKPSHLKPLPKKMKQRTTDGAIDLIYSTGYNKCLKDITGEEE